MAKGFEIPQIPPEQQTPLVRQLSELIERLVQRIAEQDEQIGQLKDEVAVLKGEKKRPRFKPSRLDPGTDPQETPAQGESRKRPGSAKRSKTATLAIDEERTIEPSEPIPAGSRFKGYRDVVVQDLVIRAHTIRYRLARWLTPDGRALIGRLPESIGRRHFGPTLASYVLYQHHHCQVTQPLLLEQLREWGVDLSAGQLDALLTADKAGHTDYRIDAQALAYMQQQGLAQAVLRGLSRHPQRHFADRPLWEAHLQGLGIERERHRRIATEGALLASVLQHGLPPELAIVSDDAGQFDVLLHALCWVHAERLIHTLVPLNDAHRQDIAEVRSRVWSPWWTHIELFALRHRRSCGRCWTYSPNMR